MEQKQTLTTFTKSDSVKINFTMLVKHFLSTLFIFIMTTPLATAQRSPEHVVQKQLDTYNRGDLEGFMATMSQEVALYSFGSSTPIAEGYDAVKAIYANLFEKSPKLESTLTNRIVLGNKVLDHESITGRLGSTDVIELVVIYEVKGEKISRVTVLRKEG